MSVYACCPQQHLLTGSYMSLGVSSETYSEDEMTDLAKKGTGSISIWDDDWSAE